MLKDIWVYRSMVYMVDYQFPLTLVSTASIRIDCHVHPWNSSVRLFGCHPNYELCSMPMSSSVWRFQVNWKDKQNRQHLNGCMQSFLEKLLLAILLFSLLIGPDCFSFHLASICAGILLYIITINLKSKNSVTSMDLVTAGTTLNPRIQGDIIQHSP